MNDTILLIALFGVEGLILLLAIFCTIYQEKNDQHKDTKIANHVAKGRLATQKQILIAEIRRKVTDKEYSSYQKASADLTTIFPDETNHLRLNYPELTDIDICVLQLLAIGLDNQEILTFLDMSKRTFYKRRQLIAGRVGLLASQLDQFAYANLK